MLPCFSEIKTGTPIKPFSHKWKLLVTALGKMTDGVFRGGSQQCLERSVYTNISLRESCGELSVPEKGGGNLIFSNMRLKNQSKP